MRIRDRCSKRVVLVGARFVVQKNVYGDGARLCVFDAIDEIRKLIARPRPRAFSAQAVIVNRNDERGTLNWDRACKSEREIVGGGVQLDEVSGPGQRKDRNGHETAGGYHSQQGFHLAAYYTLAT